ncbi:MAG: hypothetical protein KGZ30_00010 [Anaplasmataceae bacterium]|nr:hypothetical protein [Anaplasmataceae bacterium]
MFTSLIHARMADETSFFVNEEPKMGPWFTGPLLAPSGHVVPVGYINIEPYVFASTIHAAYDRHWHSQSVQNFYSVNPVVYLQVGVTEWMDVQVTPQCVWNHTENVSATRFGDLEAQLDFQLLKDSEVGWWPAIKLSLKEIFPTGHYQNLNPEKLNTDISGSGSFNTGVGLVMSRLFWFGGVHFLGVRFANGCFFPAPVEVRGFNTYGGGYGTHGRVYPGLSISSTIGLEFSMTQRWALACDIAYQHSNRDRFKGTKGIGAIVGFPSQEMFSLAPAIEYNWSQNLGLIAGCWFTVAGRNVGNFVSGVIALNYVLETTKGL